MKTTVGCLSLTFASFVAVPLGAAAGPQETPAFRTLLLGDQPPPPARIESMAWLAGEWTGEGLGGSIEEIWSAPRAGVMTGMFRHFTKDRPTFYEFFMLAEEEGSVVLKVKHFNPDFSGWEEKADFVRFPLVKVEDQALHFDGLSYVRDGEGALKVYLRIKSRQTGQVREEELQLRRAR
jgi:hypothetical protein